jgi:protein TonB
MFDMVTGKARHIPTHATVPILVSTTAQALALITVLMLPALFVANAIPEVPTMMAFVAPPPTPPAPPPPPAPKPPDVKSTVAQAHPIASTSELVAPVEAPREIAAEPVADLDEGVPGGVEGGVPGGVVGGVVGGLPELVPPPRRLRLRAHRFASVDRSRRRRCCNASSPTIRQWRSMPIYRGS